MRSLDLTTREDFLREYAPEMLPGISGFERYEAHLSGFLLSLLTSWIGLYAVLGQGRMPLVPSVIVFGFSTVAGAAGVEWYLRRKQRKKVSQLSNMRDWEIYETIVVRFADDIERQRARALGPDSEWGRSRRPLEHAAQEADRSVAYWNHRVATDPTNEIARTQLDTAQRLRNKFQEALTVLDARAHVLVSFFNECHARLAVLQNTRKDYEEVSKLDALSARADDIVTDAGATLAGIGNSFLEQAMRVGAALGGLERAGIVKLAGAVPVEQIETLADRILESSQRENTELERLIKDVSS